MSFYIFLKRLHFLVLLSIISSTTLLAQLSDLIQEVSSGSDTYRQQIEIENCDATLTIEAIDKKGNSDIERYEFNLFDIDERTITYRSRKDLMTVSFYMKNKNAFIKAYEEDEFEGYQSQIELYAVDNQNAKDIVEALKSILEDCPNPVEALISEVADFETLSNWLVENVTDLEMGAESIQQRLIPQEKKYQFVLEQTEVDKKGDMENRSYQFDMSDLDYRKIDLNIKGIELNIEGSTKEQLEFVSEYEEGALESYENEVNFFFDDIQKAKVAMYVLEKIIPYAEKLAAADRPTFETINVAIETSESQIENIRLDEESINQSLSIEDDIATYEITETGRNGESFTTQHIVHLADLNKSSIDYAIKGNELMVVIKTTGQPLIQVIEEGEMQNYASKIYFLFEGIDEAKLFVWALDYIIPIVEKATKDRVPKTQDWLIETISQTKSEERSQLLTATETTCNYEYEVTIERGKQVKDYLYEFSLSDMNSREVALDIRGKNLEVTLGTLRNEKIIKAYENSEPDDYTNELSFECTSIENAKDIVRTFQSLIEACKQ